MSMRPPNTDRGTHLPAPDEAALEDALRALPPDWIDALLVCVALRRPDAALLTELGTIAPADPSMLAERFPNLLETCDAPLGVRPRELLRRSLASILRRLAPNSWADIHSRAARYYARRANGVSDGEGVISRNEELFHLWMAAATERHVRLDAIFRERLLAHDADGCESALEAVVGGGGEGDPLLALCRGIVANEITRDWGAAEAHFHEVLAHPSVSPTLQARALMALGLLERYQGRYSTALRHLDESCRLIEREGDMLGLARVLTNRGIVSTEGWVQGQLPRTALEEALGHHIKCRDIAQELQEPALELQAWNNIGTVYKAMDRLDDALAAYRAALSLTLPEQSFRRAILTNNIAEVQEAQGLWTEAQQAYEEALAIYRDVGDDYEIADALLNLGSVQERLGLIAAAMARYREAVAAVESVRARLKAEEARAGFLATRLAPYERFVALSLEHHGGEALAFEMVERAKARAFIELLADRPLRPPEAVPRDLLDRERSIRGALSHLYQMGAGATVVGPVAHQAVALETELEEVYRQMRRLDAQYAGCRAVDPLGLTEVQRRLPRGAAVLEYFEVKGEIGCFVIDRVSAKTFMLPGAAEALRRHLASGESGAIPPAAQAVEAYGSGDGLYASLLAPVDPLLAAHDDLYVVPHGLLHHVPLHALGVAAPLLQRHRVVYAPSASILVRDHAGRTSGHGEQRQGCLALGYNGTTLRYAEFEARHVAGITGGAVYVGAEAVAPKLQREGMVYRTVHLACHGTFNPQAPLASGLMLADGKLDAMTILQNLELRADLVVLSACDSGQAALLRGDELMGLARSILYAGADAVLVSLWPVDDLATALLMDAFYRARAALPPGLTSTAEALRQAQLLLRSMPVGEVRVAIGRLGTAVALEGEARTWADPSPAPHMPPRERIDGRRMPEPGESGAARDHKATLTGTMGNLTKSEQVGSMPYGHPYFWAPFTLICGTVST